MFDDDRRDRAEIYDLFHRYADAVTGRHWKLLDEVFTEDMTSARLGSPIEPNILAIRVQPEEGIALRFEVKVPGIEVEMASVDMDFRYAMAFGELDHDAYETLLLDCMLGEATLFTRSDEVEAAWAVVDPIIDFWANKRPDHFPNYSAGSWGPTVADEFIAREGAKWREP